MNQKKNRCRGPYSRACTRGSFYYAKPYMPSYRNLIAEPPNQSQLKKNKNWWEEKLLLYGLSLDFVNLFFSEFTTSEFVKEILPGASEFSMQTLSCDTPGITCLVQEDFDNGPFIIKEPGIYKLEADIIFSPFPENGGKPTNEWLNDNIDEEDQQAYTLGVFAAIVIQCDNVCLDLNKKTLKQSKLFFHQQTFYSHIELANTPFIRGQGPADFGLNEKIIKNIFITNGTLGLSSHFGIHGNLCKNIVMHNLRIENFAVAAIQLNGSHNVLINHVVADNSNQPKIEINSLFSQAQFMLEAIERAEIKQGITHNDSIKINGSSKFLPEIKSSLKKDINKVLDSFKPHATPYPPGEIFHNEGGKLDANMYGIVFNTKGVVVGAFKDMRENNDCGNSNIVLNNVCIKHIESKGTEIKVLTDPTSANGDKTYGSGGFVGAVGDVFDYEKASDKNGFYNSNCLANAQLFASKYKKGLIFKRTNIPQAIRDWAAQDVTDEKKRKEAKKIDQVIADNKYYALCGRDSMNHHQKGNIGLFIQQAYRFVCKNLTIEYITNTSKSKCDGSNCSGILFSGSENVLFVTPPLISHIKSDGIGRDKALLISYKKTNIGIS